MQSMYMVSIPPLWFHLINPRVDALRDHSKGIKGNKTCFDNYNPLTEKDKQIKRVGQAFLAFLLLTFTYFTFFSNLFII